VAGGQAMTRTQLTTRLHKLEALVPTHELLRVWPRLLREAADVVSLDAGVTEALCAAVQAHLDVLSLPRLVHVAQLDTVVPPICAAVIAEIDTHLPDASQRYAFRLAASQACMAEARRRGFCPPEDGW
jgi:hypothetical protein